jgi:hypothetical protein
MRYAKLIYFGLGGHGIELYEPDETVCSPYSHLSGYESPESFERRITKGDYDNTDLRNCPVLDKRAVLDQHPGLAWSSPMTSARVPDGEVEQCPMPDPLIARALEGSFGVLAVAKLANPQWTGLDTVSIPQYVAWWVAHGARYGTMSADGTHIEWHDPPSVTV